MPIAPSTIFFEDYFESADPHANYDPNHFDPPPLRGIADFSTFVVRGEGPSGEDCMRLRPSTAHCANCGGIGFGACGAAGACLYGPSLVRRRIEGPTTWYHVRSWIRVGGSIEPLPNSGPEFQFNWSFDPSYSGSGSWNIGLMPLGLLMPTASFATSGELALGEDAYAAILFRPNDKGPRLAFRCPGLGNPNTQFSTGITVLPDEWNCYEIAVGDVDPVGGTGIGKLWFNGELVVESQWDLSGFGPPGPLKGPGVPTGFYFGAWADISQGGLVGTDPELLPHFNIVFRERHADRRWGLYADFARIAAADGPIGCLTRGGTPPDEPPDPDAKVCRDDDYDTDCVVKGECGRIMFRTNGLTREAAGWETVGNGFPSEKSAWFEWTAPRSGRFIWRTRGSEVFNEISVHRHTGALPPPTLVFADDDEWDPTATTSSAVEVVVEKDVVYRIRVASASDGWIIVDWGPARPLVQDDGWSVAEESRATLSRVAAVGPASGLAVQDAQVATGPGGAGTEPTLGQVLFGTVPP